MKEYYAAIKNIYEQRIFNDVGNAHNITSSPKKEALGLRVQDKPRDTRRKEYRPGVLLDTCLDSHSLQRALIPSFKCFIILETS